jgi:hypothetical protein
MKTKDYMDKVQKVHFSYKKKCVIYLQEDFLLTIHHIASQKLDQTSRMCSKQSKQELSYKNNNAE